jgi:hypothetical protein
MNRQKCAELLEMVEKHGPVMRAFSEGAEVQVHYPRSGWGNTPSPDFLLDREYRVKPAEPALDIPWNLLEERFICAAMDLDGVSFLYSSTSISKDSKQWVAHGDIDWLRFPFKNLNPRNVPWNKTITYRPGFEPKE